MNHDAIARMMVAQYRNVVTARARMQQGIQMSARMNAYGADGPQIVQQNLQDEYDRASNVLRTLVRMHNRQLLADRSVQ